MTTVILVIFLISVTKYITEQHKGEKIYLGSQFQCYHSIKDRRVWWSRTAHILVDRKQRKGNTGSTRERKNPRDMPW
jgi:hypothetical protein